MIGRRIAAVAAAVAAAVVATSTGARADEVRDLQWHLSYLHVADAHATSQGEGVIVGVTDTGVDPSAPELGPAVLTGKEFGRNGNGNADTDGHGTAMAGLIAGRGTGTNAGVLGIAPRSTILPLRVAPALDVGGSSLDLAAGIDWAADHGVKVLCVALSANDIPELRAAVAKALDGDIVIVAAAGNLPEAKTVAYPARAPGVLAVGGVDHEGRHAEGSTAGPEVAISAPAVDIVSTDIEKGYRKGTGTSDAAAIVAGAAALVRSRYPQLSAPEVIRRLTYTAQDEGAAGRDDEYGYGIVDLVKALTAEVPPPSGSPSAVPPRQDGQKTTASVVAAVGVAVVVVVLIAVLQGVLRGRRRR